MLSYNRRLLLATTALAGSALFAGQAIAGACAPSAGVVVCDGSVTASTVNTAINTVTGSTIALTVKSTGTVDTSEGAAVYIVTQPGPPALFEGAVNVDNKGQIGTATPSSNYGLFLIGDPANSANAGSVINEFGATINNSVAVYNYGGTASVSNAGIIATGGNGDVYVQAGGDATFSSLAGSITDGAIYVESFGPADPKTGAPTGGVATATALGDAGLAGGVSKTADNPAGFLGSEVVANGVGRAAVIIGGRSGSVSATSDPGSYTTSTGPTSTTDKTTGDITTVATSASTSLGAGAAVTVNQGADVFGTVTVNGGAGVSSATIYGTVHDLTDNAVTINGGGGPANTTTSNTLVTNAALDTLSYNTTYEAVTAVGGAQLKVGPTGNIEGGASLTAGGNSSATINGAVGGDVTITAAATDFKSANGVAYDPTSLLLASDSTSTSSTNLAPTVAVTIGATTGSVKGNVSASAGGAITAPVDGTVDGTLSLTSQASNTASSTGDVYTYDKLGNLISTVTTDTSSSTASGGAATLGVGSAGVVKGAVTVLADGGVTATIGGKTGALTLGSQATNSSSTSQATNDTSGDYAYTVSNTESAGGGGATLKVATGAKVSGNASVSADKTVSVTNQGTITGDLTVNNARTLQTASTQLHSQMTTVGAGATTVVNQTVGGAADIHNNGIVVGSTTVNSLGAVTFENAGGLNVGNVNLTSQGAKSTFADTYTSTDTNALNDAKDPTKGSTDTTSYVSSNNSSGTPTGGSVTGTYAGIVGLDNTIVGQVPVGAVAGTLVLQTADQASTVNVTGVIYGENVISNAGAYASASTYASTDTNVFSYGGKTGVTYLGYTVAYTGSGGSSSTPNTGGVSTVDITGRVAAANVGSPYANVSANGLGAASVVLNNGEVDGSVSAISDASASSFGSNYTETTAYGPAGALTADTYLFTDSGQSKAAGGAALVDLSQGANLVKGDVSAAGDSSATVTIGASSAVGGSVSATSLGSDTTYNGSGSRTYNAATALYVETYTTANTWASAAIGGGALAQVNGAVGGNVAANAGAGSATVNVNNTVGGSVSADARGYSDSSSSSSTYIPGGEGGNTYLASTSSYANVDAGGIAVVNLTAPAAIAAKNITLVGGDVSATGYASGTVNIGAGAIVGGSVDAGSGGSTSAGSTTNTYSPTGAVTRQVMTSTSTQSGGAASVTNAGNVGGGVTASDAGTGTATLINTGFVGGDASVGSIGSDVSSTTTTTNLGTLQAAATVVTQYQAVGGTATLTNGGGVLGNIYAAGAAATVTNNGGVAGGIYGGQSVLNETVTTVNTPTSTSSTSVAGATPFAQSVTVNQNGLVLGGISIGGVTDGAGLVTSTVQGAINLKTGSATLGAVGDSNAGDRDPTTNQVLAAATVNVNLSGTGFLGVAPKGVFGASPSYNAAELATLKGAGSSGIGTGSITGVNALTMTGPGTFYFYGSGYNNMGTADPTDDFYDIQAKSFVVNSGQVQFALSSPGQYGINANVTNSGSFVLGSLVSIPAGANLTNLLNPTRTLVSGLNFNVLGNFTQSSSGVLVTGVTPDLIRAAGVSITPGLSTEVLGDGAVLVASPAFTVPGKSVIPMSTTSFMKVNGAVTLAGTVSPAVNEGALYANGSSTPLIDATGAVSISGAKVTPLASSQFVGFELTTAASGTDTIVSITTVRTSYTTAGGDLNAKAAAAALDSAVSPTIAAITADANGTATFATVQRFSQVQDMANVISGLDWYLSPGQVTEALHEMSSGEFYGSLLAVDNTRLLSDALGGFTTAAARTGPAGVSVWLAPAFRSSLYDGNTTQGAGGLRANDVGINGGVQFRTSDQFGFGFAAGWSHNRVDGRNTEVTAGIDTFDAGANASYQFGGFYGLGKVVYGHSDYNTDRTMPALARIAQATFGSDEWRGGAEIGYDIKTIVRGLVTPFASIDLRDVSQTGFVESGSLGTGLSNPNAFGGPGGLALIVSPASHTFVNPAIGVRWGAYSWNVGEVVLKPDAVVSYTFLGSVSTAIQQQFVGGGAPFVTHGIDPDGYATVGLGLKGEVGNRGSFWINGSGDFGARQSSSTISAGMSFKF